MSDDFLQHKILDGVTDYISALDTVCESAKRTLNLFEKNFEGLGFDTEIRSDSLHRFLVASPINRLNLLVHDPQHLIRYCPRMMSLLRQFGNSMFVFQTPKSLQHISDPFSVADNSNFVRRYHFDDTRGILAKNDPQEARRLNSRFNEMWASSHSCVSGTKLGL